MKSFASIFLLSFLATLTPASPVQKRAFGSAIGRTQFKVQQVPSSSSTATKTGKKFGLAALQKAYQKYNIPVPSTVEDALASAVSSALAEILSSGTGSKSTVGYTEGSATASSVDQDEEYICSVQVGNDFLNLNLDTGSSDFWVFSNQLPASAQAGHRIYTPSSGSNSSGSLMSGSEWSIKYGDGTAASGVVYTDRVVVAGVTATSQAVEAATTVSSGLSDDTTNDGIVGLAFASLNMVKPNKVPTFFDNVKSQLATPLFAANLMKGAPGSYDFGAIDFTGDIAYTTVDNSKGFWMFTAENYIIGPSSISVGVPSIVDTGTTLILVDDTVVAEYYNQVQGAGFDESQGVYAMPCSSSLPDFSIVVDGQLRTVPGDYINYSVLPDGKCFGGIQSNQGAGFSILGDIFIKSQYVVFDQSQSEPRLGFGQKV